MPYIEIKLYEGRTQEQKQALVEKITYQKINITRDTLKIIYNANPKQFTLPERVKLAQVYVRGTSDTLIKAIYKRLSNGEAFAGLATRYSEGTGKDRDGEVGWVSREQLPKELVDVVFGMKVNTYSEPIKVQEGFHIILLEDKAAESIIPFDQVEQNLYNQVVDDARGKLIDAYIDAWEKTKDKVEKNSNLND